MVEAGVVEGAVVDECVLEQGVVDSGGSTLRSGKPNLGPDDLRRHLMTSKTWFLADNACRTRDCLVSLRGMALGSSFRSALIGRRAEHDVR